MHKQLEVILAALFPIMILVVSFFVVSSKAGLHDSETAKPEEAGPYYRYPGVDNEYFGPGSGANDLCGEQFGFDIIELLESANVDPSVSPGAVDWERVQNWRFGEDTPWGFPFATITLDETYSWSEISDGNSTTGSPWTGTDHYVRLPDDDDEHIIRRSGSILGWRQEIQNDNTKYICPMYYRSVFNLKYFCADWEYGDGGDFTEILEDGFGDPVLVGPPENQRLSREVRALRTWYDCKELK